VGSMDVKVGKKLTTGKKNGQKVSSQNGLTVVAECWLT